MRVLVPVDLSASDVLLSLQSAARAIAPGATVHLLYVRPADPRSGFRALRNDVQRLGQERLKLAELAVEAGLGRAVVDVRHGLASIGSEVMRYAHGRRIDEVVIPSHGRRGVNRWLYGSVAAHIRNEVSLPIRIVPIGPALTLVEAAPRAQSGQQIEEVA